MRGIPTAHRIGSDRARAHRGSASAQTVDDPIAAAGSGGRQRAHLGSAGNPDIRESEDRGAARDDRRASAGCARLQAADTVGRIVEQKPDAQVTMRRA